MKKSIVQLLVFAYLVAPSAYAHGNEHHAPKDNQVHSRTISGVISDSMCQSDHSAMIKGGHGKDNASCARACWQEGNTAVLVDKRNNVYKLSNAESVSKYAGQVVTVTGDIDNRAKVIHVHSVKAQQKELVSLLTNKRNKYSEHQFFKWVNFK